MLCTKVVDRQAFANHVGVVCLCVDEIGLCEALWDGVVVDVGAGVLWPFLQKVVESVLVDGRSPLDGRPPGAVVSVELFPVLRLGARAVEWQVESDFVLLCLCLEERPKAFLCDVSAFYSVGVGFDVYFVVFVHSGGAVL